MSDQPTEVDAETARRWAEQLQLPFPELSVDEAPKWMWYEGTSGQFTGYLPADWRDGEQCSYATFDEWQETFGGFYERFADLGVCTLVTRGEAEQWQDDPFPIPRLTGLDEIAAWQEEDGWWLRQVREVVDYVEAAFEGFEVFGEPAIRIPEDSEVASIQGWANHLPYSEWQLALHDIGSQGYVMVAGPPSGPWALQKVFPDRDSAVQQMTIVAEILGSDVEVHNVGDNDDPQT